MDPIDLWIIATSDLTLNIVINKRSRLNKCTVVFKLVAHLAGKVHGNIPIQDHGCVLLAMNQL